MRDLLYLHFISIWYCHFYFSHFNRCMMLSHGSFNLLSLMTSGEYLFMCSFATYVIFFSEMFFHVLPICKWIFGVFLQLNFQNSLYLLGTNPLSDMWFANTLSQFISLSFHFLTGSFTEESLFWWGPAFQFSFLWIILLASSLRTLMYSPGSWRFSPLLFLKTL